MTSFCSLDKRFAGENLKVAPNVAPKLITDQEKSDELNLVKKTTSTST